MTRKDGSVGIVKTRYAKIGDLKLESGETLPDVTLAYETYGQLNSDKSNAILICHALSGDAHAAGKHRANSKKYGWYDIAVGPGKPFDTNKYFVICSNIIGGCRGSTGPSSISPKTGKPYGLSFPTVTVRDFVAAEKRLVESFGIKKLFCATGASLGGMQVLQWAIDYPNQIENAIVIASAVKQYPLGIAFNEVGRQAILNDPSWNNGSYAGQPQHGLSLARQVGHITYLSQELLERKFGRGKKRKNGKNGKKFGVEYDIQSYLRYKGRHFVGRFDANSYLYITWAIDNFDLMHGGRTKLKTLFEGLKTKFFVISFTSDWLYPSVQNREITDALSEAGVPNVYRNLDLPYGHDSFLVYNNTLGNALVDFLEEAWSQARKTHISRSTVFPFCRPQTQDSRPFKSEMGSLGFEPRSAGFSVNPNSSSPEESGSVLHSPSLENDKKVAALEPARIPDYPTTPKGLLRFKETRLLHSGELGPTAAVRQSEVWRDIIKKGNKNCFSTESP